MDLECMRYAHLAPDIKAQAVARLPVLHTEGGEL
jgi:hypothetical protein